MKPAWGHRWVARSGPWAQSQEQIQLPETELLPVAPWLSPAFSCQHRLSCCVNYFL